MITKPLSSSAMVSQAEHRQALAQIESLVLLRVITIPPIDADDVPALLESINFVLKDTAEWEPGLQRKAAPALAVLRAVRRKALEATDV